MKLKNKKTGEVVSIYEILTSHDTLAELNEEWEDYEEPKEYWYFDMDDGKIYRDPIGYDEEWVQHKNRNRQLL